MPIDSQTAPISPPSDGLLPGPSPGARAAARIKAGREETMAALLKGGDTAPDGDVEKPVEKPKAAPVARAAAPVEEPDADAPDVDAPDADEEPAPKAAAVEAKPDAETAKRLARLQAEEKKSRAKLEGERAELAKERAQIEKARAELATAQAELAAFNKLRERAKVDPVAALEALGVDDLEHAAKSAYAKHKGDPANKAEVARTMREKERDAEVADLKKRMEARDAADRDRAEADELRAGAAAYMADVTKVAAAGEVSPLAKHFLAKHPEKTDRRFRQIAVELLNETGDAPDADDVVARYEKTRREELEELGIDPATILTATTTKKPDLQADKKPSAKTLDTTSAPRVPRRKASDRESRAETLAMLESGKLDS